MMIKLNSATWRALALAILLTGTLQAQEPSNVSTQESHKASTQDTKQPKHTHPNIKAWIDPGLISILWNRDISANLVIHKLHLRYQQGNIGAIEIMEPYDHFDQRSFSVFYHAPYEAKRKTALYGGLGISWINGTDVLEDKCYEDDRNIINSHTCLEEIYKHYAVPVTIGATFYQYIGISTELQVWLNQRKPQATLKIGVPIGWF